MTAVLVVHDGTRWLPEVLEALAAQTRKPERFVATDTESNDGSPELITDTIGPGTVVPVPRTTTFGDAVQAGLDAFADVPLPDRGTEEPLTEWIWLLHDDCAPEPEALDALLTRVTQAPSVWMVGPKVRAWDNRRLLEAGLSISPNGVIDTGIDGLEIDQAQRDEVDEVLAVGTAGALIRRDVWDRLGGLDPAWPTYADDIDLGWRINSAGGRVVVESGAVVRHVRAQTIGRRRSAIDHGTPTVTRRRSGMQVVLSNTSGVLVPLLLVRYLIGGLLRALGHLLVERRPAFAAAELRAVAGVFAHPQTIATGRKDRARLREVSHRELRHLFPPAARRWHSSPFWIERTRVDRGAPARSTGAIESGPVSEEAESLDLGESILARFLHRPGAVVFVVMAVISLIAERHVLTSTLHGGRLLPAPGGASDLWSTYTAAFHPSSVGATTAAPPALAILALLSTLLLGKVWLAVDVILLGAVPFAALSAYTAAGSLTSAARVRVWVAIVYSLLPALTGAVAGGRIDVAVVAILLPHLLRALIAAVRLASAPGGLRRSIGAGLLFAVAVAFAPLLWLVAVPALVVGIGFIEREAKESALVARLISALTILLVPLVVLMPWTWHVIAHPRLLLDGMGLPEFYVSTAAPSGIGLALLHAGGPAQPPVWIGIPIIAGGLLGLNRQSRMAVARTGMALLVIGVAIGIALTRDADAAAAVAGTRHWPGLVLLIAGAGSLVSTLVAVVGARPALRQQDFGWQQPAVVVVVGLALLSTGWLAIGWMVRSAGAPLVSGTPQVLPLFTQSELAVPSSPRALVIAKTGSEIRYSLVRRPTGPRLGDADTAPIDANSPAAKRLAAAVSDLVGGRPGAGDELAPLDISFVVAATDTARAVAATVGRADTLTVVPAPGATVWQSTLPTGELTLLSATAASQARNGASLAAPVSKVLRARPGSSSAMVPAGSAGRLLVLAEPANGHWHASIDGTSLPRATAYGWAQAFVVPARGGKLDLGYGSGSRTAWLVVELVTVVILVGAMLPGRRPEDELEEV
ncbi:MAG: glycosyltransferase family 2 protein [Frankiaceae bacterium]|nr:glycosyltransferase family 2 protein [Frankiaceae bacterium]